VTVFVDTSALYALLSVSDRDHERARTTFARLLDDEPLVSHNYVELETISLVHARHGRRPLPRLRALLDVIECVWVDEELHAAAWERVARRGRTGPSFVDLVSFEVMARLELTTAFAFDDDFATEGYSLA
jgi:predicted nucleic acid-binding protein